jgi:hypothetical protein
MPQTQNSGQAQFNGCPEDIRSAFSGDTTVDPSASAAQVCMRVFSDLPLM